MTWEEHYHLRKLVRENPNWKSHGPYRWRLYIKAVIDMLSVEEHYHKFGDS